MQNIQFNNAKFLPNPGNFHVEDVKRKNANNDFSMTSTYIIPLLPIVFLCN